MAVALLQPGQQLAKELHPVLDSLNKGLDSVMNLPIVKQLLGTMNWVMDKVFDQICAVIPLKEIFAYIADKLNPVSDETLEQIRTCIQGWKELSFEKLQPITNAFSRCIPRQPKLIGLSEYLGVELSGDDQVQIP